MFWNFVRLILSVHDTENPEGIGQAPCEPEEPKKVPEKPLSKRQQKANQKKQSQQESRGQPDYPDDPQQNVEIPTHINFEAEGVYNKED